MPRDIDLIRELLLRFEQDDTSIPEGRSDSEVAYHVNQMIKAGLLEGEVTSGPSEESPGKYETTGFFIHDITPSGHDFIAAIKSDGFWSKLKREAEAKVAPLTLDLLIHIAKAIGKKAFGLSGELSD